MAKNDDKLEKLEEYVIEKRVEDGIRKGLTKWAHTICITATSALMTGVYSLGGFVYDRWEQFSAAIDAFIRAGRQ